MTRSRAATYVCLIAIDCAIGAGLIVRAQRSSSILVLALAAVGMAIVVFAVGAAVRDLWRARP